MASAAVIAGCGSGGEGFPSSSPPTYSFDYVPTGLDQTKLYTWDIAWIDSTNERYYQCDRTLKGVDVFDIRNKAFVGTISGPAGTFTGPVLNATGAVNNAKSGPNGCTSIPGTNLVYAGDVNNVVVVDGSAMSVVTKVNVNNATLGGTGLRADEACFDPKHKIYMIATPDVDNSVAHNVAFLTVLDASNPSAPTVRGYISFFDATDPTGATPGTASAGLEQCAYDAVNDQFLINNDGTVANPFGEVDALPAASVAAITGGATVNASTGLAGFKLFATGGTNVSCNPRGLDLGPGTTAANAEFAINCSNAVGKPMTTLIMNRSTGAILATAAFGGGDQLMYDPSTNRYYVTGSNWNSTGIRSSSPAVTPQVGVIAATSGTVVAMLQAGQGSHAVAVDPVSHLMFVPHTVATATVCPSCVNNQFANSGVSVYVVQ